jgi:3-hydroxyisobutyrate dehydrogenase-like beta-hydroxyacid dehydrogenase
MRGAKRSAGAVGIIGLGYMGGGFARHLVDAGWRVVGSDIDAQRVRILAEAGVEIAPDAATLARRVPTLITSLASPRALEAVVAELVAAKLPAKVVVETSTFTLTDKIAAEQALAGAGHAVLDCPVSGGTRIAEKDIVVYASGDKATIARLKPMFGAFSRAVHDVGTFGNGSRMKFVANLLVAVHNVAAAEAMALGMKAGLDPQQIVALISTGAGSSRMFERRAPIMAKGRYDTPSMKIATFQKDLDVIGDHAARLGVPTPTLCAASTVYTAARSMGFADQDTSAVCAVLERLAGMTRR